ncbi:MAG: Nif3-like dinuclear metal center hexameric protein, partial [Bacteroidia bacterium]|nr:Nif3-like dinuclear metal center hexameric protein [Bacteroidia bacterium]
HLNGVNRKIADKLGLKHTRILSPKNADNPEIGSGIIGELETPVPTKKFLEHLKISMKAGCIRHTPIVLDHVQKIALCGGSGSFLINKAIEEKADIYISGDIKYHEFFDANDQLIIADIGHYESEQYTIELIIELLTAEFSNFAAHFTNLNTNPINYF